MSTSAECNAILKDTISPSLLGQVRTVWFEHIKTEDGLIFPSQDDFKRWFVRDESFDQICAEQFKTALDQILESKASAQDMLEVIDTSSPLDWLSVILLLDQVPRNCYRGDASKMVFERFDPLAEAVALHAIDAGIPAMSSVVRYRLAYRMWFQLPLMHSEKLSVHEKAVAQYENIAKDVDNLLTQDPSALEDDEKECHEVLSKNTEAVHGSLSHQLEFEKRHKVIIERFGRYPHRNQALGRSSTAEEVEYLENGGETFAQ
ncbi:Uncharacterized protein PECH_002388 [Penicillium ucsense]|uniref:DUF924-domain-containing protein n=1 Tax=Penicillium ucsense TaxID=2839758 RepID=A0A8J8WIR2_9EURO|nr:Uncharacterized protein PECM_003018 [Penicillium ucsense]KAF7737926.1 Uncharacterized protein PECH_002388 [Penicillium ucsense]